MDQCRSIILNLFSNKGGVELVQAAPLSDPPSQPPQYPNELPWCVCNKCHAMPTALENVCCKLRTCITSTDLFESTVLDLNVILNRSEVFVDEADYSPASYRKAVYIMEGRASWKRKSQSYSCLCSLVCTSQVPCSGWTVFRF